MTTDTTAPAATSIIPPVHRYHPAQVILHWLIAALIIITALLAGGAEGEGRRQFGGGGTSTLALHMTLGIAVLVLLAIRLVVRWRIKAPEWATTGSSFLDRIGRWTHIGLYFFAFAVTVTGIILALQTNRLARIFNPSAAGRFGTGQFQPGQLPPPGGFQPGQFPRPGGEGGEGGELGFLRGGRLFLGAFHGFSWTVLLLLIILHVAAALYHQFFRRDNLFSRMWFGSRTT